MQHNKPIDDEGDEEEDELFEASSETDDESSSEAEPDEQEEGRHACTEGNNFQRSRSTIPHFPAMRNGFVFNWFEIVVSFTLIDEHQRIALHDKW